MQTVLTRKEILFFHVAQEPLDFSGGRYVVRLQLYNDYTVSADLSFGIGCGP
jgi:hypothetical protein